MSIKRIRDLFIAIPVIMGLADAISPSAAQAYEHAPFRNIPIAVMQASTLEALALPGGTRVTEEAGAVYAASLAARDPQLAHQVHAAIATALLPRVLVDAAFDVLMPQVDKTVLQAAVAARLLLSEAGLVERYEESVETQFDEQQIATEPAGEGAEGVTQDWNYIFARAALDRVSAIVAALAPRLSVDRRKDAQALLVRLAELLPEQQAKSSMAMPEVIESHAQALVVLLEQAADADLYIDRNLAGALDTVRRLADESCHASDPLLGAETLAIAARYHDEVLTSPLELLAPVAQAQADAAYTALVDTYRQAVCLTLVTALDAAKRTLYPEGEP